MSFDTHRIYDSVIISSGWTSQIVSATTISAGTFYGGSLSASFVGNQNVTDQEFLYFSGVTSNVQTQINNKFNISDPFITNSGNTFLTNEKILQVSKMSSETINNEIRLSLPIRNFVLNPILVSLSQTAITDFNPIGYNDDYNNQSAYIIINGGSSVISGISGGTEGKILYISNVGTGIVVIENKSTKCNPINKIITSLNEAIFLSYLRTIKLMYSESNGSWIELTQYENNNQFDTFDEFLNQPQLQAIENIVTNTPSLTSAGLFSLPSGAQLYFPGTAGFTNTVTNFLESNSVLLLRNGTTSAAGTGVAWRSQRNSIAGQPTLLNSKISLTTSVWDSQSLSFSFGFNQTMNTYNIIPWPFVNFSGFMTPITSDVDKSIFYYSDSVFNTGSYINRIPLSLKLSSCTNAWCYLSMYSYANANYVLLSSLNNNEYNIEYIRPSATNRGVPFFGLYTNSSINPEGVYIDWFGLNNNRAF